MLKLTPLKYRIRRGLLGRRPLFAELSDSSFVIHPPETTSSLPVIYLAENLQYIRGYRDSATLQESRLRRDRVHHRPIQGFVFKNIVMIDGCLYKGAMFHPLIPNRSPWWAVGDIPVIEEAVLASSYVGNLFFGHFLTDDLPLGLLAAQLGSAICVPAGTYPHEPLYREFAGVQPPIVQQAYFKQLIMTDDILTLGSHKRQRYDLIRDRFRARVGPVSVSLPGVMLVRGNTGNPRRWLNEDHVAQHLAHQWGFKILYPQQMTVPDILSTLQQTRVALGVEGSQLTHAVLGLAPDGLLVVMQRPESCNHLPRERTDCLGMRYAFLVGHPQQEGFTVDLAELDRLLDRAFATLTR